MQGQLQDLAADDRLRAGVFALLDFFAVSGRQASLENRTASIEKSTKEQLAGELQALEAARQQAARDLASANGSGGNVNNAQA